MKTLIKNGALVTAADTFTADLLIDGERIAQIGADLRAEDAHIVNAAGQYVLPGGIDVHTHLHLPGPAAIPSDDFYTGHKAAAFGGTTFTIDFAMPARGERLHAAVERWRIAAQDKAVVDYGLHVGIVGLENDVLDELPALAAEGLPSLKLLMAYKGIVQVDDDTLFKTMLKAAEHGMLTMVHAENGDAIDELRRRAVAAGHLAQAWHARTRPAWLEGEATLRASALAAAAGAPLYVVHVTSAPAVDQIAYSRARGLNVMGETCVQYFFFTEDDLRRPDGAKWVCSPPFRSAADQAALWQAVRGDTLQVISTDHCPFLFDGARAIQYEGQPYQAPGKELGRADFTKTPNGVPGLGDRMPVLWTFGVGAGRLSLNRFVEVCCTNPAKIFGLYPKKGTLAVGADADVVIWDPRKTRVVDAANSHQRVDYNLYEGWTLTGLPARVYRRGKLIVDGDRWLGRAGDGRFTPRAAHAPVL
jgi:dihydropyrimidinase